MTGLEDKYLTTKNMWITELPNFIGKPLFAIVHFFKKVKNTVEYFRYIWKYDLCFDMDYLEFLGLMEYKLERMTDVMEDVGNERAKKQIQQTLMYLEQYLEADVYVSYPEFLKDKKISDLMDVSLDENGNVQLNTKLTEEETEEYTKYIQNLADYEEESWDLFWGELKDNLVTWG